MLRVDVKPELLRWARDRAGLPAGELMKTFPKLSAWERGEQKPTLKQLEDFASTTHVPIGFLFLDHAPIEEIPIPDLRTMDDRRLTRPSPDLLETLFLCQQRQEWYRDAARLAGEEVLPFVGSLAVGSDVVAAANAIRTALGLELGNRKKLGTWADVLRRLIECAEDAGILVMTSGVVANNNKRRLQPSEFRGFALPDPYAPLVFINGADPKEAQMFTLVHELVHVWAGQSALSDDDPLRPSHDDVETWCNHVASEVLVPLAAVRGLVAAAGKPEEKTRRLAREFKVSPLVALRRVHDVGVLRKKDFSAAYQGELARLSAAKPASGGDFYATQAARVGKRFARMLLASTIEGQTLHRDALRLLGLSKVDTLRKLGQSLGLP